MRTAAVAFVALLMTIGALPGVLLSPSPAGPLPEFTGPAGALAPPDSGPTDMIGAPQERTDAAAEKGAMGAVDAASSAPGLPVPETPSSPSQEPEEARGAAVPVPAAA
ncbi:MAG: hypothetical protein ACUVV6_08265, partial [Thermoplasmatota archaeon]